MPMFNPVVPSGLTIGSTAIASGTSGRLIYDAAGVAGEMSGTSWDDTNRALTLTGATVTTSNPLLNLSQTWNAAGVAFTGIKSNVTNTLSAAGSLLMDLQVGGASQLNVGPTGTLTLNGVSSGSSMILGAAQYRTGSILIGFTGSGGAAFGNGNGTVSYGGIDSTGVKTNTSFGIGWAATVSSLFSTALFSDAANTLALRNGTAAQTFNVYGTFTDTNNYERCAISNSGSVNIYTNQSSGTGAAYGHVFKLNNTVCVTIDGSGNITGNSAILSYSPTMGIGYRIGAGGTVTQATSRTTSVTLSKITGAITLVSAAGSATPATFTVTNTAVAATDVIHLVQKSGTDLYVLLVTAVAAGSFNVTAYTTGGTTTEAPVISFAIIKGVTA